jgi:glutamate decarboxylase
MPTFALNFSRPGGQIAAQYYTFLRLGREGFRKVHGACHETAQYLAGEIAAMGPFDVIFDGDPERGIPCVSWRLTEGVDHGFTLFDLADRLRTRGWLVPAYTMPPERTDLAVQRILVRHGFSRDLADLLLDDYRDGLAHLSRHPVSTPLTEAEAGSFHH